MGLYGFHTLIGHVYLYLQLRASILFLDPNAFRIELSPPRDKIICVCQIFNAHFVPRIVKCHNSKTIGWIAFRFYSYDKMVSTCYDYD